LLWVKVEGPHFRPVRYDRLNTMLCCEIPKFDESILSGGQQVA
jgi:hypothetical protein